MQARSWVSDYADGPSPRAGNWSWDYPGSPHVVTQEALNFTALNGFFYGMVGLGLLMGSPIAEPQTRTTLTTFTPSTIGERLA